MSVLQYLPSSQFAVIVGSVLLSGGLVAGAHYITQDSGPARITVDSPTQNDDANNWRDTLSTIQTQADVPTLTPPSPQTLNSLLAEAKTPNLTTTIGRSLLINLSAAKAQGLGSDVPTQDQLVAQARAQIEQSESITLYTNADLTITSQSADSLRTYGNGVMSIVKAHPKANYQDTVLAVGRAVDTGAATHLSTLIALQGEYRAIMRGLLAVPVPATLAPLHLKLVNNFARIVASYTNMQKVFDDPLRGLAGLDTYTSTTEESGRVFISIAQALEQNGILFSESEPGSAWNEISQLQVEL